MAALAMGPICVAQITKMTNRTAKLVPVLSKLISQRSFRMPTPTVRHGPENKAARLRATARVAKFWEQPPTMVKIRERGSVAWKTILLPYISQAAVAMRAPIPRPYA
jgi:hypothetical protein